MVRSFARLRCMVDLSVVVATQGAKQQLRRCLVALAGQSIVRHMEVLVVEGSDQPDSAQWLEEFPMARRLLLEPPNHVPALWMAGIRAAQGEVVALTIENCIPSANWAESMLAEQRNGPYAGVGGAMEMDPAGSVSDWAIFFSRYNAYMLPFQARLLGDLPGDNCSYKRAALLEIETWGEDGFWETFVHEKMRGLGQELLSAPSPVVVYGGGISGPRFLRRRFAHAKYFAARRGEKMSPLQRILRALAFPAVAVMLFWRIVLRVWRNGRHRAKLASSLPWVCAFLVAWSFGEAVGYLDVSAARKPPAE